MPRPSIVPFHAARTTIRRAAGLLSLVVTTTLLGFAVDAGAAPADAIHYGDEAFREPPSPFWPGYFWVLNDQVDLKTLLGQLDEMRKHDARSVCILPEPREFRPDSLDNHFDPPYLSDNYFKIIRAVVDRCRELGMNYWVYDEGGWPSGSAAGRVYRENPQAFGPKTLSARKETLAPGGRLKLGGDDVAAAVWQDGKWRIYRPGDEIVVEKEAVVYRYVVNRSRPPVTEQIQWHYVDLLHPDVTPTFLRLTHDGYKKAVGDAFGKTIRFTFTDEPNVPATRVPDSLTWTDDMAGEFRRRKGYDLEPSLPAIFNSEPGEPTKADPEQTRLRTKAIVDFYDVWSQLFQERYAGPIREWCHANGLESSGHFNGEDLFQGNATYGHGHLLRQLRGLDVPGTDVIWRQIHPGEANRPFSKYASSVAHQKGEPYVMCEMLAVYGNGVTPGEIRWLTDFQYARGTTLPVLACYAYSTRDHHMAGERPHFGPANPYWKHLPLYHAYTARLGYLLSRGLAAHDTAVYYDVRGVWAGGEDRDDAVRRHEAVAAALLGSQCGFDFVDDDVLSGREGKIDAGSIVAGPMCYTTLVVPATRWMEPDSLDALARFVRDGGNVLAVEAAPAADGGTRNLLAACGLPETSGEKEFAVGKGSLRIVTVDELGQLCRPLVRVAPACGGLRVVKRELDDKAIYFLANEGDEPVAAEVRFDECGPAVVFDCERGVRYPLAGKQSDNGFTARLDLPGRNSIIVGFGFTADAAAPARAGELRLALDEGWSLRPLVQYRVGEHDYEIEALSDTKPQPVRLGDWKELLGEWFSGDVEYSVAFDWDAERWGDRAALDLGKVQYACEVFLNGKAAGKAIWAPYQVELASLQPGRNELRVVVTNTLANALLNPHVREDWAKRPGPGWTIGYDKKAAEFEKDSLPSGLLGPVRLLAAVRAPTIVMLGDSTTAPRDAIAKVYADRIADALRGGIAARVINSGVPGDTTDGARQRFAKDVLDHEPDLAVIQLGANDSAIDVWRNPPETEPRISPERYEANLRAMIGELRKRHVAVILMTTNHFRWTPKLKELYGKPPYNPDDPASFTDTTLRKYNDVIRKVAREENVRLVDVLAAYDGYEKTSGKPVDTLLLDGMHPNDRGHELVAELLLPAVREEWKP